MKCVLKIGALISCYVVELRAIGGVVFNCGR